MSRDTAPRRSFFGHVGGAIVLGAAALIPKSLHAQAPTAKSDGPDWPGALKGRHKQVVDAYEVNAGFPLAFAYNFLAPNESATAVIILRHGAFPLALDHAIQNWRVLQDQRPRDQDAGQKESLPAPQAGRPPH